METCGSYQINNIWIVTLKSLAANQKLVSAAELEVKGKLCMVLDPNKAEVRIKIHWVPFHLPDDIIRKALEPYGQVHEVVRETWRVGGFQGVQSSTRAVQTTLKEGVTDEQLPHQLRLYGGNTLVVVPGRGPLYLRCRKTGHVRKTAMFHAAKRMVVSATALRTAHGRAPLSLTVRFARKCPT